MPKTITATLARACCVLLALVVVTGVAGAPPVRAEEPAALENPESADVEEMAGALGFASSHSPGFWEALTQAVAEQRTAAEQRAAADEQRVDAERAEQLSKVILEAATYGRRIEETYGDVTYFTELIPPSSGDIVDGTILVRTGTELVAADGTKTVLTKYFKPHSLDQLGVVVMEEKDGVQTVTEVNEFVPGSIDVKVGDTRPVPPPGSSAAGLKPHTIDPKADGSFGRASGSQPDGGESRMIKDYSWTAPPETTAAGGGSRLEFDTIKLPDGREFTPFLEDKPLRGPQDLPYRSGYVITHPDWDGAIAQITIYFDRNGKVAGVVAEVIKDGVATIVSVEELIPGSLGLKKGDTRPATNDPGKVASSWDPKPNTSGSSGSTSGGTPTTGGSSGGTNGGDTQDAGQPRQVSEPATGERSNPGTLQDPTSNASGSSNGGSTGSVSGTSTTSGGTGDSHPQYEFLGVGPERTNEDGSVSQNTLHRRTEDDVLVQTITTTHTDGTQSQEQHCFKDSQEIDCAAGRTDEPTCRIDCDRLAMLSQLFSCSSGGNGGAECGQPPEGVRPNPSAGPGCDDGRADQRLSDGTFHPIVYTQTDGVFKGNLYLDCSNAEQPGGPIDYGDPTDPNGGEPPDPGQLDPLVVDDGVTDPANPGEPEETLAGGTRLDTYGTLRDPANPPGTEDPDHNPAGGPPNTSEAERNPLP